MESLIFSWASLFAIGAFFVHHATVQIFLQKPTPLYKLMRYYFFSHLCTSLDRATKCIYLVDELQKFFALPTHRLHRVTILGKWLKCKILQKIHDQVFLIKLLLTDAEAKTGKASLTLQSCSSLSSAIALACCCASAAVALIISSKATSLLLSTDCFFLACSSSYFSSSSCHKLVNR